MNFGQEIRPGDDFEDGGLMQDFAENFGLSQDSHFSSEFSFLPLHKNFGIQIFSFHPTQII
jgi:hypothetical protein